MNFETNKEVLEWYERQDRALTSEFISSIPWDKVKDTPFDEKFVPILYYMRDVETLDHGQRRAAQWPFDDAERFNWHYVPRARAGVAIQAMGAQAKAAVHDLLRHALSEVGYRKATDIMALEVPLGLN